MLLICSMSSNASPSRRHLKSIRSGTVNDPATRSSAPFLMDAAMQYSPSYPSNAPVCPYTRTFFIRSDERASRAGDESPLPEFTPVATPPSPRRLDARAPDRVHRGAGRIGLRRGMMPACRQIGDFGLCAAPPRRRAELPGDGALDYAIRRLSDAAFSRAPHGVSRPVSSRASRSASAAIMTSG